MRSLTMRYFRRASLLMTLAVCACRTNAPLVQCVSWHHESAPLPSSMTIDDGPFTMAVERHFTDSRQEALLRKVEEMYPVYKSSRLLEPLSQPPDRGEPRWWLEELQGIKVPATLWAGAVDHLAELIQRLRRGQDFNPEEVRPQEASLHYEASIEPADVALEPGVVSQVENLFVVRTSLVWESRCGIRCGLSFTRSRTALIQGDGVVVEIYEDPLPSMTVY